MNIELYIHIPFCLRKCYYCDFLSMPANEETKEAYTKALINEIACCGNDKWRDASKSEIPDDAVISSIYIGGGTPSALGGDRIFKIMTAVKKRFTIDPYAEITCEINPGTVDIRTLSKLRFAGINRVSIGLQSADDKYLKMLGRIHSVEDFEDCFRLVREAGFKNVSVDLIHSLPDQTIEDWERSLKFVCEHEPEHISAYSLMIEEGTPFYEKYGGIAGEARVRKVKEEFETQGAASSAGAGKEADDTAKENDSPKEEIYTLPSEEEDREMNHITSAVLGEYGYHQYEISNYAKDGFWCRHNLGYWSDVPYIGLGLGASSYISGTRFMNTKDLTEYLNADVTPKTDVQHLSEAEREEEFFFLGLRRSEGVSAEEFEERFDKTWDKYIPAIKRMESAGFLESSRSGKSFRLTIAGQDVSNAVFAEILI